MLFGIGLHALEDSWSHEGRYVAIGHLVDGHSVDRPDNDPKKAREMALAVCKKMDAYMKNCLGCSCAMDCESIVAAMAPLFRVQGKDEAAKRWKSLRDCFRT